MIKVIPAILAKDKKKFDDKINKVKGLVDWVQIDICPGSYWNFDVPFKVEAHVLIKSPDLKEFVKVDKIIVHQGIVSYNKNYALILAVNPCESGGNFKHKVLKTIKQVRKQNPNIDIAVDGGINLETGKLCVQAGANVLIAGTYLFKAKNIKEALYELQNCG